MSKTTDYLIDNRENMILEAAKEAADICLKEGITLPNFEDDSDLIAWYEQQMNFEPSDEEERPF